MSEKNFLGICFGSPKTRWTIVRHVDDDVYEFNVEPHNENAVYTDWQSFRTMKVGDLPELCKWSEEQNKWVEFDAYQRICEWYQENY